MVISQGIFFNLFVVVSCFSLSIYKSEGGRIHISKEEDLELERQLKILNKPSVKTIHREWGDIVDCVDINKQPAFDHPSLKNHKIQMRPNSSPKSMIKGKTSKHVKHEPSNIRINGVECPDGTVPIRRTTKEDLIRAKSFTKMKNSTANAQALNGAYINLEDDNKHTKYFGANADIYTYNPSVAEDQFSGAQFWVESFSGAEPLNSIQAGWIVAPPLYNDHQTRLFTYWAGTGSLVSGCYNTLCSGYVQVHRTIYPTIPVSHISTYGGVQYYIHISVFQAKSGDWWLNIGGTNNVGYWPKALFNTLGKGADSLKWGGSVSLDESAGSPPLGSGHFPDGNFNHSCFFAHLMYVNDHDELVNVGDNAYKEVLCPRYGLNFLGYVKDQGTMIEVGGPGGNCTR